MVHKMRRIHWIAEELLASQEGLCFMELVGLVSWLVVWLASQFCWNRDLSSALSENYLEL